VIDVSGAYIEGEIKNIETKGNLVKSVRCANQSGNVARVVVDLQQKLNHKIIKSGEYLIVYISRAPISENPAVSLPSRGGTGKDEGSRDNILYVAYEPDGQKDKVVLSLDSYENYNIVKNVEKNKIIIDIRQKQSALTVIWSAASNMSALTSRMHRWRLGLKAKFNTK